jgi:hypothetical protein
MGFTCCSAGHLKPTGNLVSGSEVDVAALRIDQRARGIGLACLQDNRTDEPRRLIAVSRIDLEYLTFF